MTILIVEHPDITQSTGGLFQLYFYKNLFDSEEKKQNHK